MHNQTLLGIKLTKDTGLKELLRIKNALIVNVKDPAPGLWKLKVKADDAHTIRITGLSPLDFVHGFSKRPTLDLSATKARPIRGMNFHI